MFVLAILLGIYSYAIFVLGLLHVLHLSFVLATTGTIVSIGIGYALKTKKNIRNWFSFIRLTFFEKLLVVLFFLQAIVNLVGALGPELAFDALWYHLTLPKMYIQSQSINFIPGGLLYYSAMPKLTEMMYTAGIMLGNEILAKIIHYLFGIAVGVVLYIYGKKIFNQQIALLAGVIFYSNLVVGWESITAYIDLTRTFFEILALFAFLFWIKNKKTIWLICSALMVGLAITTKLLAIGSLGIFLVLLFWIHRNHMKIFIRQAILFLGVSLLVPLPWLIFSFIYTDNPFYPAFSSLYRVSIPLSWNPFTIVNDLLQIFLFSPDPISPLYAIILPLIVFTYHKMDKNMRIVLIYSLLALFVWYLTPRTGGGRFLLPYLPAFSLISAYCIYWFIDRLHKGEKYGVYIVVLGILCINILYRGVANAKYLPVIFGYQTKADFLSQNLNFSYGDFYDIDSFFVNNITVQDKVLLYGFHNVYYVNFPFIHESFIKKGERFNYIAVQAGSIPSRFSKWEKIYYNTTTQVNVYTQGKKWETY